MAIGARDFIDKLLVEKYAQEKVDNHENLESKIPAKEVMDAMSFASNNAMNYLKLAQRLSIVCYTVNAKAAKYQPITMVE